MKKLIGPTAKTLTLPWTLLMNSSRSLAGEIVSAASGRLCGDCVRANSLELPGLASTTPEMPRGERETPQGDLSP